MKKFENIIDVENLFSLTCDLFIIKSILFDKEIRDVIDILKYQYYLANVKQKEFNISIWNSTQRMQILKLLSMFSLNKI
jgi:hypothetical protein